MAVRSGASSARLAWRPRFDAFVMARPWLYRLAVCFLVCLVLMVFVDLPLAIFLRHSNFQAAMPAWEAIENFGQAQGYLLVAFAAYVALLVAAARRPARAEVYRFQARYCLLFFATLGSSAAIVHLIKAAAGRLRPSAFFRDGEIGFHFNFAHNPYDSFPSGHTHTVFAVAAVLAIRWPAYRWPLFLLASIVGFSRLVQSAHWLSDVVMAAFISVAMAHVWAPILLDPARDWPGRPPWAWRRRR